MQPSIWEQLVVGVAVGVFAGVLTTALLFFIRSLWLGTFVPKLEEIQYRGVSVDGKWVGVMGKNEASQAHSEFMLLLKQRAHKLAGTYLVKFSSPENCYELEFSALGQIWEGYVTLQMTPIDKKVNSSAMLMLKVQGGGSLLVGQSTFRNVNTESVDSYKLYLMRPTEPARQMQTPRPRTDPAPGPASR